MPPTLQGGAIGPPFPLREQLERFGLARTKLLKGTINAQELLQLQEETEDIADQYGIHIMWFETHAALYGRFNGVFRF